MPTLTGIDLVGIQPYVFASNRLRDVAGGSWLVERATSRAGLIAEVAEAATRVLVGAGGNAILESPDRPSARDLAARYTRALLEEAPGLECVVQHEDFAPGGLAAALEHLMRSLAVAKTRRIPSAPLLGLGVTAACRATGRAAGAVDAIGHEPISAGVRARRDHTSEARAQWDGLVRLLSEPVVAVPNELDQLGRTRGEISQIGIVHVDLNGVGTRIGEWLRSAVVEGRDDAVVRDQLTEWSKSLDATMRGALGAIVERTHAATERQNDAWQLALQHSERGFALETEASAVLLPLRPILLGGDDLTIVSDGRIALDLAETALRHIAGADPPPHLPGGALGACAGVAVVRSHAPFAQAYALAESLCQNAKRWLGTTSAEPAFALDWHIGPSRPGEPLTAVRQRQYRAGGHALTWRPYRLGEDPEEERTWRWLSERLLGAGDDGLRGPRWREHRARANGMRELVRLGPDSTRAALEAWQGDPDRLDLPPPIEGDGFDGGSTPLLDAVELLDLHFPLRPVKRGASTP